MDITKQKINWFPGHMSKALRNIAESTKNVDLIIEVIDARVINTSSITETLKFDKPILKVALKADYADIDTKTIQKQGIIVGSLLNKNFKSVLINGIENKLSAKKAQLIKKGLVKPVFYLMVIGLPNIGKSSLINFLASKNLAIVKNMAGVTKAQNILKINDSLYLEDNPGVMFKNIDNIETGYKLALVNCIKKEILPSWEIAEWAYNFYSKNYLTFLFKKYDFAEHLDYSDFLIHLCKKYNFLSKNSIFDTQRANEFFFNELLNNKICRVNYEK